ncbi:MAG: DDE-type integrase/transposase/recombinase, partial [Nitrosopumilaceae archaeon]|nr:DDE-type integrase/transposase/recombinase [Nitrosopumilaceae archaeon]NIU88053.1 DDE-type integrase/transposase/recombinase [Nitrosopumilaceae archaeon]NIV66308.1 DDE-type integrase/transposase/recombinase [Nitrosopumilaceae archaeon]NIX62237.1 DDE-type integrase/transposase/recombinase [Nitrosopumilaceae archaeon]
MNSGKIRDLNQRDYKHSKKPWRYQCLECGKYFYAHTSKLFRQLAIRQQLQIMFRIAKCGSKLSDIAVEFGISQSAASKLASKFRSFVKNRLEKKYGYYILYQNIRKLQTAKSQSVITDETFVRIGQNQYYIIVAINGYGEIICWKMVESREFREIAKLLFLLFEEIPMLSLLVTDAFRSYPKALRHMPRDLNLTHVQHIHKQPRGSVRIRYIERDQSARACIEYEWLTQSQFFKKYPQTKISAVSSYLSLSSARLTLFRVSRYSEKVRKKIRQ